jgi:hypothetical protein
MPRLLIGLNHFFEHKKMALGISGTPISHQIGSTRTAPAKYAFYKILPSYQRPYGEIGLYLHAGLLTPFASRTQKIRTRSLQLVERGKFA